MSWVGLDDGILDNPKIAAVGPIGFALHVAAIVYCARNLTNGFVPFGRAKTLLATAWADPPAKDGQQLQWSLSRVCGMMGQDGVEVVEATISHLVTAELWEIVTSGYQLHDYLDWNPSREEVLARRTEQRPNRVAAGRASAVARKAKYGSAVPKNAQNAPTAEHTPEQAAEQPPNPIPIPIVISNEITTPLPPFVEEIYELWKWETGRNGTTRLTPKRKAAITARRREYSEDDIRDAVLGVRFDPWPDRVRYNDLTLILRDGEHLERFRDLYRRRDEPAPLTNPHDRHIADILEGRA